MSPAAPVTPISEAPTKRGRGRPKGSNAPSKTPTQRASAIVNKIAKLESALGKLHLKSGLGDEETLKIEKFLGERQEKLFRIFREGAVAVQAEFEL